VLSNQQLNLHHYWRAIKISPPCSSSWHGEPSKFTNNLHCCQYKGQTASHQSTLSHSIFPSPAWINYRSCILSSRPACNDLPRRPPRRNVSDDGDFNEAPSPTKTPGFYRELVYAATQVWHITTQWSLSISLDQGLTITQDKQIHDNTTLQYYTTTTQQRSTD